MATISIDDVVGIVSKPARSATAKTPYGQTLVEELLSSNDATLLVENGEDGKAFADARKAGGALRSVIAFLKSSGNKDVYALTNTGDDGKTVLILVNMNHADASGNDALKAAHKKWADKKLS